VRLPNRNLRGWDYPIKAGGGEVDKLSLTDLSKIKDYDRVNYGGLGTPGDQKRRKGGSKMPAACGIACEVCGFLVKGVCPIGGCVAGTDERAPEKLEKVKEVIGMPCAVLECAIKNKVDYCLKCEGFPCEIHYREFPFSKKFLDVMKGAKEQM